MMLNTANPAATLSPPQAARRVLVVGMLGPGLAWISHAVARLIQFHSPDQIAPWSGWANQLPDGTFPAGDAVVRTCDFDPTLVAGADHVVFSPRDLRDAVVAYHRTFNLPPDCSTALRIVEQMAPWESQVACELSYESILTNPPAALEHLAKSLELPLVSKELLLRELQGTLAAGNLANGAKFVPRGAYISALRPDVVAQIEAHCGAWLVAHGYLCTTCSAFWARASDKPAARAQLLREAADWARQTEVISPANARESAAGADVRSLVAELVTYCEKFGVPIYQLAAVDLIASLAQSEDVLDFVRAELFLRQRKPEAAWTCLQKLTRRAGEGYLEELQGRCRTLAPHAAFGPIRPGVEVPAVAAGKTAPQPLPPVSIEAQRTQPAIARLAEHVRGKVVAFLLHGSSINAFADHAASLVKHDVVWGSLNHFGLLEDRLLRPVGQEFSLVFCCADGEVQRRIAALENFLKRPGSKLLVTRPDHQAAFAAQLGAHARDVAVELLPPVWPYPNSLTLFLRMMVQAGPRRIVLFGCDGYLGDDDHSLPTYIGAEDFAREKRSSGVLLDTLLVNAHFPRILAQWRSRLPGVFPEIVNCSPGTLIQGIPTIDYAQAAAALAGEPLQTGTAGVPPAVLVPPPSRGDDPIPDLLACLNAGRHGDLAAARAHALHALCRAPGQLTPFAQRILQTDPRAIATAYHLLRLTGAGLPGSPEYYRQADFARELREVGEALGAARHPWDSWE